LPSARLRELLKGARFQKILAEQVRSFHGAGEKKILSEQVKGRGGESWNRGVAVEGKAPFSPSSPLSAQNPTSC
jgi:hypothetical protein